MCTVKCVDEPSRQDTIWFDNMFLLSISFFLLLLPHCSHQLCSEGKPSECLEAEFAPGTNLGGEGFDITKMERKGAFVIDVDKWKHKDKTCTLCVNPFLENKKQKLPLSVVDWRPKQSCSAKVSSQLHRSSEALVSSSTSSIENNWKASLDVNAVDKSASLMLAGTDSKLADYSMEKTKNDKFSFSSQSVSCEYYSYRVSSTPKLHREFRKELRLLPKVYNAANKQRFYRLFDKFGTHYITKVKIGGSVQSVTSIRQCQTSLKGLSVDEVEMCLEVEASASYSIATAKAEGKHCKKDIQKSDTKSSFASVFNDRFTEIKGGHTTEPDLLFSSDKDPLAYKDWLSTVSQFPDIISYSLDSLHELLPTNATSRKNLRSAISHYILEKGLWRNCSSKCPTGIRSDPRDPCVCQCHNNAAVNQDCCPTRRGMARVMITVQQASGLWGDHYTSTDGYVKVFMGQSSWSTTVIPNNNDPYWGYIIDMGTVDLSTGNKVRFEVWDQDSGWDDDLLGKYEQALTSGIKEDVCNLNHGRLFYKIDVQCAPSLSGDSCLDYKPSPISQSLKSWFVSRHAHPIPKAVLLEMGVFVDEPKLERNQSLITESQTCDKM